MGAKEETISIEDVTFVILFDNESVWRRAFERVKKLSEKREDN